MKRNEIEARAYQIIERVQNKQPVEDDRVELKANLLDSVKSARLVAGHANAMNGEPILWLMGVDEKVGVQGIDYNEFSDWHKSFVAQFDEAVAPDLAHIQLPVGEKTILVLCFITDRAPYVVKNPSGGHITLEVPWRQGVNTFSAKRSQLLRLLGPLQTAPSMEFMRAWLVANHNREKGKKGARPEDLEWQHVFQMYVVPKSNDRVVIPKHHMEFFVEVPGVASNVEFMDKSFSMGENASLITCTRNELIIDVPGMIGMRCYGYSDLPVLPFDRDVEATYRMRPADSDRWIVVKAVLPLVKDKKGALARWVVGDWRE